MQAYYTPAAVASAKITGTVTDLLVVVDRTSANFKSIANGGHVAGAYDLIPYSDSGLTTKLKFWRYSYDASTGHVVDIVRLPSAAVGTTIYYGYGDSTITTDQSDKAGTFGFCAMAFEFGDGTTLDLNDSTANAANLINDGGQMEPVAGIVGGGVHTFGSALYRDSLPFDPRSGFTVVYTGLHNNIDGGVVWSMLDHNDTNWQGYYGSIGAGSTCSATVITVSDNFAAASGAPAVSFSPFAFHRFAFVATGINYREAFVDGVGGGVDTTSITPHYTQPQFCMWAAYRFTFARDNRVNQMYLDDLYIIPAVQTDAWIEADANAFNNPASFLSWGTESASGPAGPTITVPAGALVLAGQLPTLSMRTAAVVLAGSLALAGLAPSLAVAVRTAVTVPAGASSFVGLSPSLAVAVRTIPPAGALALVGLSPSIAIAAGAAIPAGSLALVGSLSSLELRTSPSAGVLALAGLAPSAVTQSRITSSTVALTLAGRAPLVTATSGAVIGVADVHLAGQIPVVALSFRLGVPAGTVALAGYAVLLDKRVSPASTAVALAGLSPSLKYTLMASPAVGTLGFVGLSPSLHDTLAEIPSADALQLAGQRSALLLDVRLSAGAIAFTGRLPAVFEGTPDVLPLGVGALSFDGYQPALVEQLRVSPASTRIAGTTPALQLGTARLAGLLTLTGYKPSVLDSGALIPDVVHFVAVGMSSAGLGSMGCSSASFVNIGLDAVATLILVGMEV